MEFISVVHKQLGDLGVNFKAEFGYEPIGFETEQVYGGDQVEYYHNINIVKNVEIISVDDFEDCVLDWITPEGKFRDVLAKLVTETFREEAIERELP